MKKYKNSKILDSWNSFAFKHTASALIIIITFVLIIDTVIVQSLLQEITSLGYLGILLAGVLFVSFFTAAPAVVILFSFAEGYNPLIISVIAGFGAMLGDYIILRFAEDDIGKELKPVAEKLKLMDFINLLHKKRFKPITATLGAIIIASPFPDEAGIALLGLSRISTISLLLLTFILNSVGILILLIVFG